MKTVMNLILSMFWISLLVTTTTSCSKEDSLGGEELSALSYAMGEVALGNTTYVSVAPSLFSTSEAIFSITKITQNGLSIDNSAATLMSINPKNGVISVTITSDPSYVGEYLVSVSVKSASVSRNYPDVFRLVVKGIAFESDSYKIPQGKAIHIPVKDIYLVQESGTEFSLAIPTGAKASDYEGIMIDKQSCDLSVTSTQHAGVYPIWITIKNLTNPSSHTLSNVTTLIIESKPYDLRYSLSQITLTTREGHTSVVPTIYAASDADSKAVVYSLANNPNDQFSINPQTGVISLPEDNMLPGVLTNYKLSIKAKNSLGESTFTDAYIVTIDPDKKVEPITNLTYSDTFPITLKPGEPYTSSRPTVTGSTVGIEYTLKDAPQGVTIDRKTGVITLASAHHMPLLLTNNNLTISVKNSSMQTGPEIIFGSFIIDPVLWQVEFKTNSKDDALTNSGIVNMDRYSFLGRVFQPKSTSSQIKNGWGKSSSTPYIINGLNCTSGEANTAVVQQWNNDWLVSDQIAINSYALDPKLLFLFSAQYGGNAASIQNFKLYIIEITESTTYIKGEENQNSTTLDLTKQPSELDWGTAIWTSTISEIGAQKSFSLAAYKGKNIRFAFQFYNTANDGANTRSYSIDKLRVEDTLVE